MISAPIVLTTPKLPLLNTRLRFGADAIRRLGENVKGGQLRRYAQSLDAQDRPMPPLNEQYKRRKIRKGRRGVRDLHFTGNLYRGLTLKTDPKGFAVGFAGAHGKVKRAAYFQNLFHGFFGMSPRNLSEFDTRLGREWNVLIREQVFA